MSAPRLNRALVLEARGQAPDGAGGFVESWAALGTLWAEVTAGTGREVASDQLMVSKMGYRIRVRAAGTGAPSRPVAGHRFREGARVFAIQAVAESDPEGRYLTCFAVEEVSV